MRFDGKTNKQRASRMIMDELSGVDTPAHSTAIVSLFKMKSPGSFEKVYELTGVTDEHQHLIDITEFTRGTKGGTTSYVDDHAHPFVVNADGTITVGISEGHTHEVSMTAEEIFVKHQKGDNSQNNYSSTADGINGEIQPGGNDMSKQTDNTAETQKAVDDLKVELKKAQAFGELTDSQKSHYASLSDTDKEAFLAKSADERQVEIDNLNAADKVVYKSLNGMEYRQSHDPVLVETVKQNDLLKKQLEEAQKKQEEMELQKTAAEHLSHLPGDDKAKIALLKAAQGIEGGLDILKANNQAMNTAFKTHGVRTGEVGTAVQELEDMAKAHQASSGLTYEKAYAAVLKTKEGRELYNQTVSN